MHAHTTENIELLLPVRLGDRLCGMIKHAVSALEQRGAYLQRQVVQEGRDVSMHIAPYKSLTAIGHLRSCDS